MAAPLASDTVPAILPPSAAIIGTTVSSKRLMASRKQARADDVRGPPDSALNILNSCSHFHYTCNSVAVKKIVFTVKLAPDASRLLLRDGQSRRTGVSVPGMA